MPFKLNFFHTLFNLHLLSITVPLLLCFLLLLLTTSPPATHARIVMIRAERWQPHLGHPGLRLRLTRRGAEHVKEVGVALLSEQLASLNAFRLQHVIQQPGVPPGSYVQLSQVRTTAFQPPLTSHLSFAAPSYMVFAVEDMSISIAGRFLGVSGPLIQVPGGIRGQLVGLRIHLLTSFQATVDGLMAVRVVNCSSYVHHSHFVLEPEGPLAGVVKIFEIAINDLIKQRIPHLLCRSLSDLIERNSPRIFQRLTSIPLAEHFRSSTKAANSQSTAEPLAAASPIIEGFVQRLTDGLYMDGSMVANPVITPDYFETRQRGELRYNNSGNAMDFPPFHPRPMHEEVDSERMLYLYASDFTLNSFLYHAFQSDRLNIKLDKSTLPELYRGFVRTSCPAIDEATAAEGGGGGAGGGNDILQSICVGKLIPAIAERYPNTSARFLLVPYELPEVKFVEGFSSMDLRTRILTYVTDPTSGEDHQVLVSTVDGLADIRLSADEGKFSGELKLRKLDVHLHRSAIGGLEPESISQLAPLAKTFLGPSLSAALRQGFPYPLQESIAFLRPQLTIHEGYVRLATDFRLVEGAMRAKVREAFERIRDEI